MNRCRSLEHNAVMRLMLTSLIALFIAAASFSFVQNSPGTDPVIAIPPTVDWGFIQPRTVAKATFQLLNNSDVPIKILAAMPSCTCTTVDIAGKTIPPHGTLEVPVSMKVPASTGNKVAEVKVVYEGLKFVTTLHMKGEVAFPVRVTSTDSKGVNQPFIDAHTDPTRVRGTIHVESVDQVPFIVKSVLGKPPTIQNFVAGTDAPRAAYDITYDLSGYACAMMPPYLCVETDRADSRLVDLRIRHECTKIAPKLSFSEHRINAGAMNEGSVIDTDIQLKHAGVVRISEVESLDPAILVTLGEQVSDGDGLLVHLRLAAQNGSAGTHTFRIRMTAVHPQTGAKTVDSILTLLIVDPPAAAK